MVALEGIDTSRFRNFPCWATRISHQLQVFPSSSNPDLIPPICSISYRLYTTNNGCRRETLIGPIDNKTWRKCNEESLCFMPQSFCKSLFSMRQKKSYLLGYLYLYKNTHIWLQESARAKYRFQSNFLLSFHHKLAILQGRLQFYLHRRELLALRIHQYPHVVFGNILEFL